LFILDDERVVQAEVVDLCPVGLQLWPDACTKVVLQCFEKSRTDLGKRQLPTGHGVIGVRVKSATRLSGSNERGTELWGKALKSDQLIGYDLQWAIVDCIVIPKDAFDIAKGPIGGSWGHAFNVPISRSRLAVSHIRAGICADNLNAVSLLNAEIPSVDLRAALDGIARRWWIVVLSIVVAIGVVFAQDSGLRSEPAGNVIVERTYEALVETDALEVVKVDPAAIVPVPSFDNQLALLRSQETLYELRQKTGSDASVEVSRSEPKFTIVETIDDLNNKVSFLSTGTPAYTFRCVGNAEQSCNDLIDAFVEKTVEVRKESVLGGLDDGLALITDLISKAESRLTENSLNQAQISPQRVELASLITKRDALEKVRTMVTGGLIPVTQGSWTEGKTTASVSSSTYGFGFGVGLIIGLLLALQLTALDKTIRHAWQVRRVDDELRVLGSPFGSRDSGQKTSIASSLRQAQSTGATSALLITHDQSLNTFAQDVLQLVPEMPSSILASPSGASVEQLAHGSKCAVVVFVKTGETTRRQLAESLGLISSGGSRVLGVALIS
jgi:hypothetical protein